MKRKIICSIFQLFTVISVLVQCATSQSPAPNCVPDPRVRPGDGIDNDCDGQVDEEYCYNGIDEDDDGKMNEDCAALPVCERRGSSVGLEFVGAFMENRPDRWVYQPLEMIIARAVPSAAYATPARPPISAKIQTPLLYLDASDETLAVRTNISVTIGAGDSATKVFLPDMLRVTGARIANKGFLIQTNSSASVYGFNKELFTSDSFLQLPADSLGTDYYAITYEPSLLYTEMAMVALYSDTIVTISLLADKGDTDIPRIEVEWDGKTYGNGDTIRVRLQAFEVAQFQTEYDLTGTHVTSNLPIAFYSGNVRTWIRDDVSEQEVQSRDHLVEQIPPTDTWGMRFVAQNYPPHRGEDRVHVVASQPDTDVYVTTTPTSNGTNDEETSHFTLVRPGTSYQLRLKPNTRISLVASKPIMAAQLTHSQKADNVPITELTDPSLIYVVPVTQFDNDYFFGTSDYVGEGNFTNYVVLTAKEGFEDSIWLDGQPLKNLRQPPTWRAISIRGNQTEGEPRMVRYLQTYIIVADGVHRIRSISSNPFGAVQWAIGDRNSYAHPLGIRWKKGDCQICKQIICGDHVDNDCDGKIDEEKCDGTDSDHDGLIDEDCSCEHGRLPQTKRTTTKPRPTVVTTTTPRTTTTITQEEIVPEPGACKLQISLPCGVPASLASITPPVVPNVKVNLVFAVDWTTARLPTANQFMATSQFLQQAISNWFPNSDSAKFGVASFANGVSNFLQYLTNERLSAVSNVNRNYRIDMITNTNSDLTPLLRFIRSHMFTQAANADEDAKKIVVVLAFSPYTTDSLTSSVRFEATSLSTDFNATTYFIGLTKYKNDIAKMALADRFVTTVDAYDSLMNLAEQNSAFVRGLGIRSTVVTPPPPSPMPCSADSPFRSAQFCYGYPVTLTCPARQQLTILTANYGRVNYFAEKTCGLGNPLSCDAGNPACPYLDAYNALSKTCDFKQTCSFTVGPALLKDQLGRVMSTCKLQATYLDISYACVDLSDASACSFSPASRLLSPTNEFELTASSFASCPACASPAISHTGSRGREQTPAVTMGQCDTSNFCTSQNDHCRPALATFDHSALEAWCPTLADTEKPWLMADLGAPYVVLGVIIQGRRRYLSQYATKLVVYTSMDNLDYEHIITLPPQSTFVANSNSTEIAWIFFQTASNVARYVKVEIIAAEEHPALHLEVIIHNKVSGCEPFRGENTNLSGKRGTIDVDTVVHCLGDKQTDDGSAAYTTRCKRNAKWSVEKSCH